jgi:muramoyltetrapeptide carboxypeptidase LdcA involved in peptidoglycan recycling
VGEIAPNRLGWTVERLDWAEPANQERRRALNTCPGWNFLQGEGVWRGQLLGGCMEVFDWLRGTAFWPPPSAWDGAILFLETSEDAPPPAQLRYTLRAMAALGALQRISGLLLGRPGGGWPPEKFNEYDQAILQVIREEEGRDDLPIVTGMDFGHTDPIMTLPYGILAEIDCTKKQFSILESAVV